MFPPEVFTCSALKYAMYDLALLILLKKYAKHEGP